MPVGKTLATERRRQGKALVEVERGTKIMGRLLDALENERWSELPPPAYVRGYIINYAQFLSLDPAPLLAEYARDIAPHEPVRPVRRIPDRTVVPPHRDAHALPKRARLAIATAVIVLALGAWVTATLLGGGDTPPPVLPVTPTSTVEPTSTQPPASVPASETTPAEAPRQGDPFVLGLKAASEPSWVRVTVDGERVFEGTLAAGEARQWTVSAEATVRIGKPAAVTVTRDGEVVTMPPSSGIGEVTVRAQE